MALPSSWAAHSVMSKWPSCVWAPEGMTPALVGPTCSGSLLQSAVVRQAPTKGSATSGPTRLLSTRCPYASYVTSASSDESWVCWGTPGSQELFMVPVLPS